MDIRGDIERVAGLASRQQGRITRAQLNHLGVTDDSLRRRVGRGELIRVLPRVYAVGHTAPSHAADLWAAVLYAGPGAMLSHRSAARWCGLIDHAPSVIEVSTPRKVRSLLAVRVYGRRQSLERMSHRGIPVTSIPVTMVDLAASAGPRAVRRALEQLDFRKLLDVRSLLAACGSGQHGSTRLREALETYDPRSKYANGDLELAFLELCKRRGLPLPVLNTHVHDIKSDAYWPEQGLVVELDSELNHSSPAQRRRDRRNDLTLRGHGLMVLRYDWALVNGHQSEVCEDVLASLERLVALRRAQAR